MPIEWKWSKKKKWKRIISMIRPKAHGRINRVPAKYSNTSPTNKFVLSLSKSIPRSITVPLDHSSKNPRNPSLHLQSTCKPMNQKNKEIKKLPVAIARSKKSFTRTLDSKRGFTALSNRKLLYRKYPNKQPWKWRWCQRGSEEKSLARRSWEKRKGVNAPSIRF